MHYAMELGDLLDEDDEPYNYFWLESLDDEVLDWPWLQGARFSGTPDEPIRFKVDPDQDAGMFADYIAGPVPLVTARLKDVFEDIGIANVDYYSVVVEGANAFNNFPVYFAVNVIGMVSAAGPGTVSEHSLNMSGADLVDRLVVDTDAVGMLPLFRLGEHLSTLFVSQAVKSGCENAGVDTLTFVPADQWST